MAVAAGYRVLEGQARAALAAARLVEAGYADAAALARQAAAILGVAGYRFSQVEALITLGHAVSALDGVEAGAACWREALKVASGIEGTAENDVRRLLATSR